MRSKFYFQAINKIQLEVMKYETSQDEYSKKSTKDELLIAKVNSIKASALKKKRNKSNGELFMKALLGGTDA